MKRPSEDFSQALARTCDKGGFVGEVDGFHQCIVALILFHAQRFGFPAETSGFRSCKGLDPRGFWQVVVLRYGEIYPTSLACR